MTESAMPPELITALEVLGLAVLAGLTVSVGIGFRVLQKWLGSLEKKLDQNTETTAKVEQQTNGRLSAAEQALAAERDKTVGLVGVVRNYRDLIRYIQAQHPETAKTIAHWSDQRTAPVRAEDIEHLAQRLAAEPGEDPRP